MAKPTIKRTKSETTANMRQPAFPTTGSLYSMLSSSSLIRWNETIFIWLSIYFKYHSLHNHFLNVLISLQMSRSFVNFAVHHIDFDKQLLFIPRYANWSHVVINNHSFATTNCRNFLQGVSFLLKRNKNYFYLYARSVRDWFFSRESEFRCILIIHQFMSR